MKELLVAKNLTKRFLVQNKPLYAVEDVSFTLIKGKSLGLVGESGSGKTTTGQMLLRLIEPTSGTIIFNGEDLTRFSKKDLTKTRRHLQMIFQDPYSSLNPRMSIQKILEEPLLIHEIMPKAQRKSHIEELLHLVGLDGSYLSRYPHELSGGQKQRISIARALCVSPQCLVCDEPVSSLDVSIQAQIVHLLKSIQEKLQITYLFISHNLSIVRYLCEETAVMYLGHIVEKGPSSQIYHNPAHPYTQALLSSVFIPDPNAQKNKPAIILSGEIPSPTSPPKGCVFSTRCPFATELCHRSRPESKEVSPGHFVSCHLAEKN